MARVKLSKAALQEVDIDSVTPYPGNAWQGDVGTIQRSLVVTGQYRAIVCQKSTKYILCGNNTWKAAKAEGEAKIWVQWVDCDDETARRINLVDNRSAQLGEGYDNDALARLLGGMDSLDGTGWSNDDLNKLLGAEPALGTPDPDEIPPDDYQSQLGVIAMCQSEDQQHAVYERMRLLVDKNTVFAGVELKIVAV